LSSSWALHGKSATKAESLVQWSALTVNAGVPAIVEQTVPVHAVSKRVQEHVVKLPEVLEKTNAADTSLPDGALLVKPAENKPATTITWNAHIKVKK
jgi:hypothetical protein